MNPRTELKQIGIRINQLATLTTGRRALLATEHDRVVGKNVDFAPISQDSKERLEADIARFEAETAELEARHATLTASLPPENPADRKELEKVHVEAGKQYDKLVKALVEVDETARAFQELRTREVKLRAKLDGVQDNWRVGNEGAVTGLVLRTTNQLFQDIEFREVVRKPDNKPSAADLKRIEQIKKTKGYKEHYSEAGELANRYSD